MRFRKTVRACCGAAAIGLIAPGAQAESVPAAIAVNAENIRKLNIMLMVTSLRCRESAHDFRGEYDLFAQAHGDNLSAAHDHLKQQLVARHGELGSAKALDKMGVTMANSFGEGHPEYGCADLKRATLQLAMSHDTTHLANMADRLLGAGQRATATGSWFPDRKAVGAKAPARPYEVKALDDTTRPAKEAQTPPKRDRTVPGWLRG